MTGDGDNSGNRPRNRGDATENVFMAPLFLFLSHLNDKYAFQNKYRADMQSKVLLLEFHFCVQIVRPTLTPA